MTEYVDLLRDAYRGEVFGESFFAALAASPHFGTYREQLLALQQVEAQTAARLRPLVEAVGNDGLDDDVAVAEGVALAEGMGAATWFAFLQGLRGALPAFLEKFERLEALRSDDPALSELVAHEQAIDRFAAMELDGRIDEALTVLRDHLDSVQERLASEHARGG